MYVKRSNFCPTHKGYKKLRNNDADNLYELFSYLQNASVCITHKHKYRKDSFKKLFFNSFSQLSFIELPIGK